jgi:UDP-N-acetylglucosamine--dolichyl-phosphate N-acetylglucosaminephosphotransferase
MAIIAWMNQTTVALVLALCMVATLLAFLRYNWYPAQIFPGDTMTYAVGSLIACVAIFGHMQKAAVILFIPYIIDVILVARSRFKAEAFARVNTTGKLERANSKYYKLTDIILELWTRSGFGATEKRVVGTVLLIEGIVACIAVMSSLVG